MKPVVRTIVNTISFILLMYAVPALATPQVTTYQARILKPDGLPLEATSVLFKFTILDPAAACILYSETYAPINMSGSLGMVAMPLGSGTKVFPASATTFAQVFDNATASLACESGGPASYQPTSADVRKIVMQFNDGNGWQTLPAMSINAVPYAIYSYDAQNLGGVSATSYVKYSTIPTCTASQALQYTGASFNCVAVGGSTTAGDITTALGYTPQDPAIVQTSFTTVLNNLGNVSSTVNALASTVTSFSNSVAASFATLTSSQWITSGSTISYSAGNVGVGTSAPTRLLQVGNRDGIVQVGNTFGAQISGDDAGSGFFGSNLYVDSAANIKTTGTHASYGYSGLDATWGSLKFYASSGATTADATVVPIVRMAIDSSGNVGIGTTTPTFKFELVGTSGTSERKIGINGKQVIYLPDQTAFTGSLFIGDGGGAVSHVTGSQGYYNTSVGIRALVSNTTGNGNTANGYNALFANTTGNDNVATGASALYNNTLGNKNVATGVNSLYTNTTGDENVANGYQALYSNETGYHNVANGSSSLYSNTSGADNVATGARALYSNTTGYRNVANGSSALYSNVIGANNTATGAYSLTANDFGESNTAYGSHSLYSNSSGSNNVANGFFALGSNSTGSYNVAIGDQALYMNTTGTYNVATGPAALYSNTTGGDNVANGSQALYTNDSGSNNVANGNNALYSNTTGNNNTANGAYSLYSNDSGNDNVANGYNSLASNTTGNGNVANGTRALFSNTTGLYNVAYGFDSLKSNTVGNVNIAIGAGTLMNNVSGWNNVAIGTDAGALITGSNNVVIGSDNGATIGALSNFILIADGAGNRRITIDNTGKVGIGQPTPMAELDVTGSIRGTGTVATWSDQRVKKNIVTISGSLNKILQLRGVNFDWRNDEFPDKKFKKTRDIGVIAQEVEKVFPEVVNTAPDSFKSVGYSLLVAPLIEAVKELYNQIIGIEREVASLKAENAELKKYLCSKEPAAPICK